MPGAVQLVAIDLDGTLVDSAPDLAFCIDAALAAAGLAPAGEALTRSWIGDGVESLLDRALRHGLGTAPDPATTAIALAAFNASYERNLFNRSRLYPGVAATLDMLRQQGVHLCCITNKRIAFATGLLREAGLADRLEFTLGGDSLARKKPHADQLWAAAERTGVAPARAVMVGDSEHDYGAAHNAGFGFVWASYGYRPAVTPVDGNAITSIDSFEQLPDVLGRRRR